VVIRYTDAFKRQLERLSRRYGGIRADLQPVIDRLAAGETPGDRIPGVGHVLYKVRLKNSAAVRGKRGGFRIIDYLQTADVILLVTIYSKSDQADITAEELQWILGGS
jgi:mRNA-degrading endonuclease RelE of RelBE toxin-antitoxin system